MDLLAGQIEKTARKSSIQAGQIEIPARQTQMRARKRTVSARLFEASCPESQPSIGQSGLSGRKAAF